MTYTPFSEKEHASYIEKLERGFFGFWVKNWRVSFLLIVMIVAGGIFSLLEIPKESNPDIEFGIISISVPYPGANPTDIDDQIISEVEDAIQGIEGIDSISSSSSLGLGSTTVELTSSADTSAVLTEIKDEIDTITFPSDAEDPFVREISSANQTLFELVLTVPKTQMDPLTLLMRAESMQSRLEQLDGVADVTVGGSASTGGPGGGGNQENLSYDIVINLDNDLLRERGLTVRDVANAIREYDTNRPLGNFANDVIQYDFRISNEIISLDDLRAVPIGSSNIRLGDIATITRELTEDKVSVYGSYQQQGFNAISLTVDKEKGGSIFSISAETKETVSDILTEPDFLGIEAAYSVDLADTIIEDYENLANNGITTLVLVFVVLLFFLGFKESMIATVALPLAFFITFIVLYLGGYTLNFLTNFSLILSLGIAIDAFLVIIEGATEKSRIGYNPKTAILLAIKDYKRPLIAGTATTAVAFIPLMMLPGTLGKFLAFIPITVFTTLVAALFISLTVNSAFYYKVTRFSKTYAEPEKIEEVGSEEDIRALLYERSGKKSENDADATENSSGFGQKINRGRESMQNALANFYRQTTRRYISSRLRRRLAVLIPIVGLVLSFIFITPRIGFELFPSGDNELATLTIEGQTGLTTQEMTQYLSFVENALSSIPEINLYKLDVSNNTISGTVELTSKEERQAQGQRLASGVEEEILTQLLPLRSQGLRINYSVAQGGPPSGAPVGIKLISSSRADFDSLIDVADDFEQYIRTITLPDPDSGELVPATKNISNSYGESPGEFTFRFDTVALQEIGLGPNQITPLISDIVNGVSAGNISLNGQDRDIEVTLTNFDESVSPRAIERLRVATPVGEVQLGTIINVETSRSIPRIQREEGDIVIRVTAENADIFSPDKVQAELDAYAGLSDANGGETYTFPEGIRAASAGEQAENQELLSATLAAFGITILVIFIILVLQFNSYSQPLIILYSVVQALLGVNIGLWLTGNPYSMPFGIGFVALTGIVVNDAIIFIDRINGNLDKGLQPVDAIVEAGRSRLQPIILTTLTTICGVLPLAFQDEFWAGLSYTVVFGLFTGSLMTLFVLPSLYYMVFGNRAYKRIEQNNQQ